MYAADFGSGFQGVMATVTVGEILDQVREFETRMEAFYADARDRATEGGVRLLTYYLARHRRHLPRVLEAYPPEQLARLCQTRLGSPELRLAPTEYFRGKTVARGVSGPWLLEQATALVERLIEHYRALSDGARDAEAKRLFQEFLRQEERQMAELKKISAMGYFR